MKRKIFNIIQKYIKYKYKQKISLVFYYKIKITYNIQQKEFKNYKQNLIIK